MLIQEVIDQAKSGELRTLAVAKSNDIDAIIRYINLGMIELYKRFPLKTEEYVFERLVGTEIYTLPVEVMWIISAYGPVTIGNSIELEELAINEEESPYSINTISWNQIQLTPGIAAGQVGLVYASAPTSYLVGDVGNAIDLPPQLIEPLLHYVGYRGHGAVDGSVQEENNTHYQRFEVSCKRIETQGMITSDDVSMAGRINDRGFV